MVRFEQDDWVRIDIPDETGPDFDRYYGQCGATMKPEATDHRGWLRPEEL